MCEPARYGAGMYWHLVLASLDRLALFPSEAHRRAAARALARVGRSEQLVFCAADDHLHSVVAGTRERAVRIGVNLALALQPLAAAPLAPAHVSPVNDRGHLHTLVRYVLDQTTHHRLQNAPHPALWPGSSFADLVGARILPGFDPSALTEAVPRLAEEDVFRAARLPVVRAADDDALAGLGVDVLARCIAGVVGHDALDVRRSDGGRALLVALGLRYGVGAPRLAKVIGTSERQVRRLARSEPDPRLEGALCRWVAIRAAALGAVEERARTFEPRLEATPA